MGYSGFPELRKQFRVSSEAIPFSERCIDHRSRTFEVHKREIRILEFGFEAIKKIVDAT
jgi:hypothetical protein